MKRTPLRRQSKKRAKTYRGLNALAVRMQIEGAPCELAWTAECFGPVHGHHLLKASQGGEREPSNLVPLCGFHNSEVENNPTAARLLGLVISQGALYRESRYLKRYEREQAS